jgi:fructokinase
MKDVKNLKLERT